MIKKTIIKGASAVALGLLVAGCADEFGQYGSGTGFIAPSIGLDNDIAGIEKVNSRSEAMQIDRDDLSVSLIKNDGSFKQTWALPDFPTDKAFGIGAYTIETFYGDATDQGFEKPAFYGSKQITVSDGVTTEVGITAALANSMFTVIYSEAFEKYMSSYSAELTTASGTVEYAADETRPAYVSAGNVAVKVSVVKPNGIGATFSVAEVNAQAQHHYTVKVDINGGAVGDASLNVEFDDALQQETITIDLSDKLLSAPKPTIEACGFNPDVPVEIVEGLTASGDMSMNIVAMAGLQNIKMYTRSASLIAGGWPEEIDLMAADASQKAILKKLGLSTLGVWTNPDQMAVLDFTNVVPNIKALADASTENTITVEVTDRLSRIGEPLTLTVSLEGVKVALVDNGNYYYPGEELTVNLEFNGKNVADNVSFQYMNPHIDTWVTNAPLEIVKVEELAARGTSTYAVTIKTPDLDSDLTIRAVCGRTIGGELTVKQFPFELVADDANVYATYAYLAVVGKGKFVPDPANTAIMYKEASAADYTAAPVSREGDYYKIAGLTPGASYEFLARIDDLESSVVTISAEAAAQLPEAGFETWTSEKKGDYQYLWKVNDGSKWATANMLTTSTSGSGSGSGFSTGGTAYKATSGTIPANGRSNYSNSYGGTFGTTKKGDGHTTGNATLHSDKGHTGNAALIRTVGYGSDNSAGAGTGNPASGFSKCENVAAGELFLGTFAGSTAHYSGIAFASRPAAMTFWYKYTSYGSSGDYGDFEVIFKDANGKVIATQTGNLEVAADYTQKTLTFDYPMGTAKCANVMVRFKSSAKAGLAANSTWLYGPGNKNVSGGEYVGSELYIDDIELIY